MKQAANARAAKRLRAMRGRVAELEAENKRLRAETLVPAMSANDSPPEPPNKREAIERILSQFKVRADVEDYEYDPAGSTTSYVPNSSDVAILEALVERAVTERDLWFNVGTAYTESYFSVRDALVKEVKL